MDETLQPRLGAVLRRARTRLELTQEQVAREVGFVPTVYGRIERGDMLPSVPKLRSLCSILGISADVLLSLRSDEVLSTPKPTTEEPPGDSPELRRLVLLVKDLPPERFRLFRVAVETLLETQTPGE